MAVQSEARRISRVEDRVNDLSENTSELRGAYEHLATKADISQVKTELAKSETRLTWRIIVAGLVIQALGIGVLKYLP